MIFLCFIIQISLQALWRGMGGGLAGWTQPIGSNEGARGGWLELILGGFGVPWSAGASRHYSLGGGELSGRGPKSAQTWVFQAIRCRAALVECPSAFDKCLPPNPEILKWKINSPWGKLTSNFRKKCTFSRHQTVQPGSRPELPQFWHVVQPAPSSSRQVWPGSSETPAPRFSFPGRERSCSPNPNNFGVILKL